MSRHPTEPVKLLQDLFCNTYLLLAMRILKGRAIEALCLRTTRLSCSVTDTLLRAFAYGNGTATPLYTTRNRTCLQGYTASGISDDVVINGHVHTSSFSMAELVRRDAGLRIFTSIQNSGKGTK